MIEPTGPLPPSVYWRRRAFAAGSCVLAVVLLAWIIGVLVGAADDQPVHGTAGSKNLAAAPSSPPPSTRPAGAPSSTASPTTAPPAASPSPAPTGRPTTRPAPPPGPPKPCPDAVVKVAAQPGQPSYEVGRRPLLRLVVVNAGKVPCTRDLSRKLRELVITSADGKTRLWSSNDCYGPPDVDVRTLAPGRPLVFTLSWAGRTSAPGCPVKRTTVPAGSYRVIGRLGALTGAPVALTMTP
ncbi:MAG: hypothetical protein GEV28_24975 [Actinophytocola sp.]|uniref:hypothetical protein n=1 Tax=Actinophytocola sp. TaxID=1872138 RepID=UPI001326E96C|nr:hypothetical protein [Actinophytocola sp.]MPZ83468.1 hypothetical protein [Actinophytocola sp.]